jgi:beta-lactamase class D
MTGILAWLAETALGAFFKQLFGAVQGAWKDWLATSNARDAGRAEATAEANEAVAKQVEKGNLAEVEARKDHANADVSKDADAGLDTEFRRRDE